MIAVLLATVMGQPSWLWMFAGLGFTMRGLQLSTTLPYPLSRTRRAKVAYAGTLIDAALFWVVAGTVLLMIGLLPLAALRLPLFAPDEASAFNSWTISLGLAFALAPIAQWPVILWSVGLRRTQPIGRIVYVVAYMIACALAARALSSPSFAGSPRDTAIGIVALAIAVQIVHWFAMRAHFTTRDLVRRSS